MSRALDSYSRYAGRVYARYRTRGLLAAFFGAVAGLLTLWQLLGEPSNLDHWIGFCTLLSAVCAVFAAIWKSMKTEIEGKYTLGLALAHGYFHNLVLRVLEQSPDVILVVFKPATLDEIEPQAVEKVKDRLIQQGRDLRDEHLPGGDGPRTALRVDGGKLPLVYLDFPRTLQSVRSLIDYRDREYQMVTGESFSVEHRAVVTRQLIDEFFEKLEEILKLEGKRDRVIVTDSIFSHL